MLDIIAVSGITMLLLDAIYLTVNKDLFANQVVDVQRVVLEFRPLGALMCYILLIFGLYYFIIKDKKSLLDAFLFGIVIYGVYESTNYAILKKWSPKVLVVDTLWGGILMMLTTFVTYRVLKI